MAQNLCRNIEVAHGQVEHDGEVVQVARSGGPIRHNFDGTVQGSPRACLAGRQVAHTGGPCGSCRRRGRTERAHRALENAARFPRASTGLSTSDHPRQTPEEPRVLLGNPDRPDKSAPSRTRSARRRTGRFRQQPVTRSGCVCACSAPFCPAGPPRTTWRQRSGERGPARGSTQAAGRSGVARS